MSASKSHKKKSKKESSSPKPPNLDGLVKSQKSDDNLKSFRCKVPKYEVVNLKLHKFHLIIICALILTGIALYSNSLTTPFLFDDIHNILESPWIKTPQKFFNHYFEEVSFYKHRIIPYSTFALNWHFNKDNSYGYNIVNLAIHILNSLLIYLITLKLLSINTNDLMEERFSFLKVRIKNERDRVLLSSAVAFLFLCHPIQTNVVMYIVQRIEALMAFFYLLSFYLFIEALHLSGKLKKTLCSIGSFFTFMLAVWSKEVALTFPLMAMVYYWTFAMNKGKISLRKGMLIVLSTGGIIGLAAYALFTSGVHTSLPYWSGPHSGFLWGIKENLYTQANVIIEYIKLLILPLPSKLNIDHDFPLNNSIFQFPTYLSLPTIFIVIALALHKAQRFPHLCFCILWWFIALIPSSSIWPIWDTMVEYRVYLPSFGFYLFLTLCIHQLLSHLAHNRYGVSLNSIVVESILFTVLILSYIWGTCERASVWQEPLSFWMDAAQKSPHKVRPLNNLGEAYYKIGRLDDAISDYKKALAINPTYEKAHNNLGTAYTEKGMLDEAISEYMKAIDLKSDYLKAYYNLGVAYFRAGKLDEAIAEYTRALSINADYAEAHNNLGITYIKKGEIDTAVHHYNQALSINPDYAEAYYNLGLAYAKGGQLDEAIAQYQKALSLQPNYLDAHINLGYAYNRKGELDKAISEYKQALHLNPNYAGAHYNLGIVYARKGRLDEAIEEYRNALSINPQNVEVHTNLGVAYHRKGELDKAIYEYKQALHLNSNYGGAHSNLATAYFEKKHYQLAVKHSDRALELGFKVNPNFLKDLLPYR